MSSIILNRLNKYGMAEFKFKNVKTKKHKFCILKDCKIKVFGLANFLEKKNNNLVRYNY